MSNSDKRISELSPKKLALLMQKLNKTSKDISQPKILAQERGTGSLPLSFAQQRLWFLDQLEPGNAIYNLPAAIRLLGRLDLSALERSLQEIVRRHEALRTTFSLSQGQATQVISSTFNIDLSIENLEPLPPEEREVRVQQRAQLEQQRVFNLAAGPLIRTTLLRLNQDEHIFLLTMHHIISDGWSMGVLTRELAMLYAAFSSGQSSPLKDLALQYPDYALWQRHYLQGEILEQQVAYWKRQLGGNLSALELPTDRPRPAMQTYHGSQQTILFSPTLVAQLKAVGKQENATLFMTLLTAFKILLYRYCQQEDIVIGTSIANRTQAEIEELIGFFVNTLVLRTDLSGDLNFLQLLARVREVTLEAYAHQDIPFEQVVEALQPERSMSRSPLFQVMFVLQNAPAQILTLGDLTLKPLAVENNFAKFDLTLQMVETEYGLLGSLEYNTDIFEAITITRMLRHFQVLLESSATDPFQSIAELPLLTKAESQQILEVQSRAEAQYASDLSLQHVFEQQTALAPHKTALRYENQTLSYQQVNRRANQIAYALRAVGVGPDILVGLALERSLETVIAILGILKAGGAYLPLDPTYPKERLTFLVQDAQVPVILTTHNLREQLLSSTARLLCLDSDHALFDQQSTDNPDWPTHADQLAYVIYTSGSTGQPKGVLVPHRQVLRLFSSTQSWFHFSSQDIWTLFHSYSFDFSVWELWGALLFGGTLVVVPYWMSRSPRDFYDLLCLERVTVLNQTPSAFRQLQPLALQRQQQPTDLRLVIFGGEALDFHSVRPWLEHFGEQHPQLVNMYGITETTVHVTYRPLRLADLEAGVGSLIGRPLPDLRIYLLDPQQHPVPIGIPGEIYVGGAGVAHGYLNREQLTRERFIADPFSGKPGARLYRTGDRARYRDNGELEYLGRLDEQVKIRGFRIELGEIESILLQHPAIREAILMAREDTPGNKRLVAYIVLSEGELEIQELRQHLQTRLPEYMLPATFVKLEKLPLTSSGKVDRRALPAPDKTAILEARTYIAPRTTNEQTLANVWEQVLGVERVGIHDNFFALGGDSILSIQIVARVNQSNLSITPKQLFQYQTVAELATVAQVVNSGTITDADQGIVMGSVPLTPIQHWFFEQRQPQPQHWNQALFLSVQHALETDLLQEAVRALLMHHDALRLRFYKEGDLWLQQNMPASNDVPFTVIDVSLLPEETQTSTIEKAANAIQASLDLTEGPLLRTAYFHTGENNLARLLIVIHHLAIDGVSWRILLEDLQMAYADLKRKQPVSFPAKTTSFQQWSRKLSTYAQSPELLHERAQWSSLAVDQISNMPVDHTDTANTVASTRILTLSLSAEETQALLHEVPRAYRTQINDVLLTALAQGYTAWTQQEAVLVDLEGHGREDILDGVDLSRTVGWFTCLYPVLLKLEKNAPASDTLKRIKEQLRSIPDHGIGYGLLRYLCADKETAEQLRTLPQAQISFNYLGQFDQTLSGKTLFAMAPESSGMPRSPLGMREHLLDISGSISGGRLHLTWMYSQNIHDAETILTFAQYCMEALQVLIMHCQLKQNGGYTPSDFPLAHLAQEQIDRLLGNGRLLENIYPLSPLQKGMLFHTLYEPAGGDYITQVGCTFEGNLNVQAFVQAWQQVIDHHTILRASLLWKGVDEPLQVIQHQVEVPFVHLDWQMYAADEQQLRMTAYWQTDRAQGFELAQAPLLRLTLIHLAQNRYAFLWSHHHILLDGWSVPIVLKDAFLCYDALCRQQTAQLEPAQPYQNYIEWFIRQDLRAAETFWRETLKGFTDPTPLGIASTAKRSATTETRLYEEQVLLLSPETTHTLQQMARQHQLTLNTFLQGAWALLLSRYSGQSDVVFGVTLSGRSANVAHIESMVGLFINTLPLRVKISSDLLLHEWLDQLQTLQTMVSQYEYSPLGSVQGWSDIQRGKPLFESLLVFENYPISGATQAEKTPLRIQAINSQEQVNYPLSFVALPGYELSLKLLYQQDLFEEATIKGMLTHLRIILESFAHSLDQHVVTIPLLTPAEQQQMLYSWNATETAYPREASIPQLFETQVERTPDAIALLYGDEQLSYAELNQRANQLAHALISLQVGPEVLVGLCLERSTALLVGTLAILKAGGAYVPLDPSYPQERIALMLGDAQIRLVITQESLIERFSTFTGSILCPERETITLQSMPQENPSHRVTPDNLLYVMYTSGSTGRPKGVAILQQAVARLVCHSNYVQIEPSDRVVQAANPAFDAATFEIWGAWLNGATLVLLLKDDILSLPHFAHLLHEQAITTLFLTTALFNQLARDLPQAFSGLRHLLFGGEAVDPRWVHQVLNQGAPQRLLHVYGPTESTTYATWHLVKQVQDHASSVPIGAALANTQIYVVDTQMQPVPVGVPGHLYIGGDGLARGYVQQPALTAERFVPNPFSAQPGARLYQTGDVVCWNEQGALIFMGRVDHQVKIRGHRIELGEIEQVLVRHPSIQEALVMMREEHTGDKRLVAYIAVAPATPLEGSEVRAYLQECLPDYMVPASMVLLPTFPLTPNGKIDRAALPEPDDTHVSRDGEYEAPRNQIEERLTTVWQQVLGIETIGIHDNFFTLGGDSILSMQIVSQATRIGLQLTPKLLFQNQTIADLASVVTEETVSSTRSAEQGLVTGEVPFTPIQHWFFEQGLPEPSHFNQAMLLSVKHPLHREWLEQAVQLLLQQHDALRMRYEEQANGWRQKQAALENLALVTQQDLSDLSGEEQKSAIEAIANEAQTSLNLHTGPLLQLVSFDLGTAHSARLLIVIHHLVVDGVSWRILLEDLEQLYGQISSGHTASLPAKTTSFQQWSQQLNAYAQTREIQQELPYWLDLVEQQVVPLPVDQAAGENRTDTVRYITVSLSYEETQALLQAVPQAYHTQINDILLTALTQAIGAWTGQGSILIDLEGHGREEILPGVDLSRTVGWFTSMYPLLFDLQEHTQPGSAIKATKERLRALPHNGVGYGILRYLCKDEPIHRQMLSLPQAEISFNYLGQFDQTLSQDKFFTFAPEGAGMTSDPLALRPHILDISGSIGGGQLHLSWAYSSHLHHYETIEGLARETMERLRALIAHCQLPTTGGYTPSDFPLASFTQEQIDSLLGNNRQVEAVYPLSPLQQGLLFQALYAPESGDYIVQSSMTFRGAFQTEAFIQAWKQTIAHHTILRTCFVWEGLDEPHQIVYRQVHVPVVSEDWRSLSSSQQQDRLETYWQQDRRQDFDLSQAPLIRSALLRLTDETYEFFWSHHHLLLDGWSLPIVLNDLFVCYQALARGKTLQLARVRPYQDYIAWLQQQNTVRAEEFWRRALAGFTTPTKLGTARPNTIQSIDQLPYGENIFKVAAETTQALQAFVREHHLTLNTVVQGAWAVLLSRYSLQDDVLFGTTVSGRPAEIIGIESMVGLFINTLPVRVRINPAQTVLSWLHELHEQQTDLRQYQYTPLAQVQGWSEVPRGIPLFESLLVFENYPISSSLEQTSSELELLGARAKEQTNYPLTIYALPGEQLIFNLLYNCTQFDAETCNRLLLHLQYLLETIVANADQLLGTLSLPTLAEREQLLIAWNADRIDVPRDVCIHDLFEAQAYRTPHATALLVNEQRISYSELQQRANQLAHSLQKQGIGPDVLVGICLERSAEMVVALLGVLKAGGAYVPLDPAYPKERLAFTLQDAQISVLITQTHLREHLPEHQAQLLCLDADWHDSNPERRDTPESKAQPEHLAYVIYTSGSTGTPKGVAIEHRSTVTLLHWARERFSPEDLRGVLATTSICFDLSIFELFLPLICGGMIVLAENVLQLPELSTANEVTLVNTVPLAMNELVRSGGLPSSVRTVNLAGEPLPRRLVQQLYALAHIKQVYNLYGPTEDTTYSTWELVASHADAAVPIGRPLPNTQAYVLDQHLQPVPQGIAGELYLAGDGLARGYLRRGDMTAERFIANPFSAEPGARIYKTGDLVRTQVDGTLLYLGRIDQQVKIRGFRIELGEVERVLQRHATLEEVVVTAQEDPATSSKRIVAYVVAANPTIPTTLELRQHMQEQVPEYMIPSVFVVLDSLPRTPNGKIDRQSLPTPDEGNLHLDQAYTAPRNSIEEALTEIWQQVLGGIHVGIHDNFFALGGDSILSLQIVSRATQMGIKLTPRQLFQAPTVAELASLASQNVRTAIVQAEQGRVSGPVLLTPVQHWFFDQHQPQSEYWNQAVLLSVRQPLDPILLEQALAHLLTHHDALRLRFLQDASGWQQQNAYIENQLPFEVLNLSTLPPADLKAAIEAKALQAQASLDLYTGPLVRCIYFDLGIGQDPRLLIVIHHLAVDGVSWRILLEDLQTAYAQAQQGKGIRLPAKTTSFQQWAQQLNAYAQHSQQLKENELNYWLRAAHRHVSTLPVDHLQGKNTVASSQSVAVSLSKKETQTLLHEVPLAYRTQINDVLLTALALGYSAWTGQQSLLIEMEGHGREEILENVDLSRTVGWFTSMYPVLLELESNASLAGALKGIKEQLRSIPHRGIGYGLLRYLCADSEITAQLDALPQAEISFNYLGQLDQLITQDTLFGPAPESSGSPTSPQGYRKHLIDINSSIVGGQLHLTWTYSQHVHEHTTMQQLARLVLEALRAIITHCRTEEAGGYTPSDFPLARLTQVQIDVALGRDRQIEAVYPLSPMQQGLLFHNMYAPESGDYLIQFHSTFKGQLQIEAFAQAWQQVVDQHAILRTYLLWENLNEPVQVVRRHQPVSLVVHDWSQYSAQEQQERIADFLHADRTQGFVLSQAPLLRLTLLQLAADTYEFVWSHHHVLLDGWSLPLVLQDVFVSYQAHCRGEQAQFAHIRSYQEYIAWLLQQDLGQAKHFWQQQLKGFAAPTLLSIDRPVQQASPDEQGYGELTAQLSNETTRALQQLARQQQLTLNTLVQGAWALVLSRYCGLADVVFGTVVSGRPAEVVGSEAMVGLFINTLPVRAQIAPDETVIPWLHALQQQITEIRQYEYSPLAQVQGWSDIPRGTALFESLLIFENYPVPGNDVQAGEASVQIQAVNSHEQTNYPLTIVALPGQQFTFRIQYDQRRFTAEAITRLLGHLQVTLASFVSQQDQTVMNLPLLTATEEQQLLYEWNPTHTVSTSEHCLQQVFEQQVALDPHKTALRYENQTLSYQQVNQRANQIAHTLRAIGVGPDILVGLALERSLETVIAILGILKAGGAYLPLDPTYPKERLTFLVQDAQVPVILTTHNLREQLPSSTARLLCLDSDHALFDQQSTDNPDWPTHADQLAYVIYTSGSTGQPKGVLVPHRQVLRLFSSTQSWFHFSSQDVWTLFHSYSFDFSVWELWGALLYGGTLVVVPYWMSRSPQDFYDLLCQEGVTVLNQTPSAFRQLQPLALQNEKETNLRLVIFGGEALDFHSVRPWLEHFGELHPQLVNMYGITETTVHVTYRPLRLADLEAGVGSLIGRPLPDLRVYLLDPQQHPVPIGVPGEIYVGGAGVARGYLKREQLTRERFILDPFSDEPRARLYRTGDRARYRDNGELEYLGRLDEQVKIRGFRIELGEIESILLQYPAVREAIVMAREDTPGNKRLVAYIVIEQQVPTTPNDLRIALQRSLPDYMVPAAFVLLDHFPLTTNGKIDRQALPIPDQADLAIEQTVSVVPQTERERILARVWEQVLGVEQVGIHDNFFALGGDSILSIQIVARANQERLRLTPKLLFEYPTIAELAEVVDTTRQLEHEQGQISGELPLTPIQHWFVEQKQPEQQYWNQAILLSVHQHLDPLVLEQAFQALVAHHDALRLRLRQIEGQWQQINALDERASLVQYYELATLSSAQQTATIEAEAREIQASLDLEAGPLLRVAYFDLEQSQAGRLLIVVHHLAIDGVSWRILLEDLIQAYELLQHKAAVKLPAKTTSFKQWAHLLTAYAQSAEVSQQLAYWLAQARQSLVPLPVDWRQGTNSITSSRTLVVSLSIEETQALLYEVPQSYRTQINDLLLTALALAFTAWTGEQSIRVNLEGHGREEILEGIDLSRTIGWFTTLFPVMLEVADYQQPVETLKAIKEYLRSIPQRGIGYGLLRYLYQDSHIIEQMRALPEAEVSFNYLGQFMPHQVSAQAIATESLFGPAPESSGPPTHPQGYRQHLIDINGSIAGGQLHLAWTYSQNFHRDETIDWLAHEYLHSLQTLIEQCQSGQTGGFTPSDFPEADVSQKDLDKLISKLNKKADK